ncbi:MAG: GH92 family glycosyl hydrolase [Bacteroidota bacterium]
MRIYCVLFVLFTHFGLTAQSTRPVDRVNVFTGTSNSRWMLNPGPTLPFGMIKLGPDNQDQVWNGGYEYTINSISGFSHLHGFGLSGVSYMPYVGKLDFGDEHYRLFPGPADGPFSDMWTAGYRSRIDKAEEDGRVGHYQVRLHDYDVDVELTTTTRVGMMRLRYPEQGKARLLLNLNFPTEELTTVHEAVVRMVSPTEIEGYVRQSSQYPGEHTVYFVSTFSEPLASMDGWQYDAYTEEATSYGTDWRRHCHFQSDLKAFTGEAHAGVVLNFATASGQVVVKTSISMVSTDNARLNLRTEAEDLDFEDAVTQHQATWNDLLNRIEVKGPDEAAVDLFYTNFYRSFAGKNILSDVNGEYLDMCERVQVVQAPTEYILSSDGFWGAQWTLFPFWTLVAPDYANSLANSMLELARVGGWIPEAPTGIEYAPIMGAQHHNSLFVSLQQKGLARFNTDTAFAAILHDYTTPGGEHPCGGVAGNRHLSPYLEYGYVPEEYGPASNTMAYAYDDHCLSVLAEGLGKREVATIFRGRAQNYRNLYDPTTGYLRRRQADGHFVTPFDPWHEGTEGGWNGPGYMEGTAWIYSWWVPHDLPGLATLLGRDTFRQRLIDGFERGYVNLTNQPNLQAPFLFNYIDEPRLTQYYSRRVAKEAFNLSPLDGYLGEEDEGQMSSLSCLLAMGLFEMLGGCEQEPAYDLGSTIFDEVIIHLQPEYHSGERFIIQADNNGPDKVYISTASLNGEALTGYRLRYEDIAAGGTLRLRME